MRQFIDIVKSTLKEVAINSDGGNGTMWCDTNNGRIIHTSDDPIDKKWPFLHHSQDVKYYPEKYDLTPEEVKNIPRNIPNSKKSKTARFDHDMMQFMMSKGWVRINSWGKFAEFQGATEKSVRKAVRLYSSSHPDLDSFQLWITPSLVKGDPMLWCRVDGDEQFRSYLKYGLPEDKWIKDTFS